MNRLIGAIGFAALAFAAVYPALAQEGPAEFQQIAHISIKPGMTAEFESIVKQYVDGASKQGVANRWWMFQQGAGGRPTHYHLVSPFDKWADRDAWTSPQEMFVKSHGEEEYADANRRWAATVVDLRITLARIAPELSSKQRPQGGVANHYLVSRTEIRPEKAAEYRLAIQKIRAGQDSAQGSPSRVTRRVIEGNRNVYTTATGFDSGADRDRWPGFSEFMSGYSDEETEQILQMLRAATVSNNWYEVNYRPDLSYTGSGTSSN